MFCGAAIADPCTYFLKCGRCDRINGITRGKMGFDLFKNMIDENEKSLFTTRKVGDLLFDGINMKLFKLLKPFVPEDSGIELGDFSIIKVMQKYFYFY